MAAADARRPDVECPAGCRALCCHLVATRSRPNMHSVSVDNMIRIVVGTAPGPRSGLWRILTRGDDIYVRHDGMRKDLKTSLHKSGANHHAWTPSRAARWKPEGDRYMMKWGFTPGGKTLLGIVLPTDHLTVPEEEPPLAKREKISLWTLPR
jgi:hypothetical protein